MKHDLLKEILVAATRENELCDLSGRHFDAKSKIDGPLNTGQGQDAAIECFKLRLKSFDIQEVIFENIIRHNDKFFVDWHCHAKQVGALLHLPATKLPVKFHGVTIMSVNEEIITHYRAEVNVHKIITELCNTINKDRNEHLRVLLKSLQEQMVEKITIKLSPQELRCLALWTSDYSIKKSANCLGISDRTLEVHRRNILLKLNISTREQIRKLLHINDLLSTCQLLAQLMIKPN